MLASEKKNLLFDWRTYYNTHKNIIVRDLEIDVKNRDVAMYHWENFGEKKNLKYFKIEDKVMDSCVKSSNVELSPEYTEFDWKQYIENYEDLGKLNSKRKAWAHWTNHGKKEGRSFLPKEIDVINFTKLNENDPEYQVFDWETYISNYYDLSKIKNKIDAWNHWMKHGKLEGRSFEKLETSKINDTNKSIVITNFFETAVDNWSSYEEEFYKDYCDFDWKGYVENYEDLHAIDNKLDAWEHWFFKGRLEGRIDLNFNGIDEKYLKIIRIEENCYPEKQLIVKENINMKPWIDNLYVTNFQLSPKNIDKNEERVNQIFKIKEMKNYKNFNKNSMLNHKNIIKMSIFLKNIYKNKFENFANLTNNADMKDPKVEYRYFCFKYLDFMRNCFIVPELEVFQKKEAVFIEFRELPNVEFIIRNAILMLGPSWSYTIICGNINYNYMITICNNICKNLKVIKTTYNSVTIDEYSDFLKTSDFWNLLIGEKILIYQEDSFIFDKNIDEFMEYDYVGAPWINIALSNRVGNGGLSLRTRQIMLDIITEVSKQKDFIEEVISEDVFFSKHMQRLGIGRLPDEETATRFSSETICNKDSFGGHQFWLSDPNWKNRMYDSMYNLILNNEILGADSKLFILQNTEESV
jgi:hypothetical protein